MADEVERAKRFAAEQVALGLDRTMISSMAVPARLAQPAVGADYDEGRLARAIDNCGQVCEVLQAGRLRPLHHSHVGGVFETEAEIVRLLDDLGPDVLGFGPDTGHLRWAGIEPAPFIRRYADRMGGIHIKDCFADYLPTESRTGMSYGEVSATKRLWAEPGSGVVDFDCGRRRDPGRLRRRPHDRGGPAERGFATWSRTASRSRGRGRTSGRRSRDGDRCGPAGRRPDRWGGPDLDGGGGERVRR